MSYVYAGYGVTFGALALYAVRVLVRARVLRRSVGAGDRAVSGAQGAGHAGEQDAGLVGAPDRAPPGGRS